MNMREHVKVVAYIYIILGIFLSLLGVLAIAGFNLLGLIVNNIPDASDFPGVILSIIGFVIFLFLAIMGLPGIIAGFGLLKYKNWARILTIILSILRLISFPIGTLIGGYSLWVLSHYETIQLFNNAENQEIIR